MNNIDNIISEAMKLQISKSEIRGAVARAYCHKQNAHKVLDAELCISISREITKYLNSIGLKVE